MSLRLSFAALTLAAVAASPFASMAAEDKPRTYTRAEIEEIVVKTLMDKPEVIIQAVEQMQVKEQAAQMERSREAVQAYRTSLFEDKDSPVIGPKDADITIVEFFDYNCGYCKRSLPSVLKTLENDKKVRVVLKEYPVLAPSSEEAARASLAMYYLKPDNYLDFHAALFRLGGKFDEKNIVAVAEGLGVDAEKFKAEMKSKRVSGEIEKTRDLAGKMGVQGVPAFIIGNEIYPGAISYEAMKQQIDAIREAMKKKS